MGDRLARPGVDDVAAPPPLAVGPGVAVVAGGGDGGVLQLDDRGHLAGLRRLDRNPPAGAVRAPGPGRHLATDVHQHVGVAEGHECLGHPVGRPAARERGDVARQVGPGLGDRLPRGVERQLPVADAGAQRGEVSAVGTAGGFFAGPKPQASTSGATVTSKAPPVSSLARRPSSSAAIVSADTANGSVDACALSRDTSDTGSQPEKRWLTRESSRSTATRMRSFAASSPGAITTRTV